MYEKSVIINRLLVESYEVLVSRFYHMISLFMLLSIIEEEIQTISHAVTSTATRTIIIILLGGTSKLLLEKLTSL